MSQPKHYSQSWRVMKENLKQDRKPSKMCESCKHSCINYSLGELVYCKKFRKKDKNDQNRV